MGDPSLPHASVSAPVMLKTDLSRKRIKMYLLITFIDMKKGKQ
jgi:hypothetical protein